ncbi:hypothetical protein SAMN05421783_11171 [Thiocapsa roseopersicina]|uniref:Uncharacterized protein n=1 Tax=Thiocapsa roseopersicina TaxID=1058 RepID=A0A1H2XPX7_THIRO|nr:hypothetical protein SAMN05421783_11171 [Thiocapsa roseopersicina]
MFQSAPDQLAGRCLPRSARAGLPSGFNPRPTNWPGDATDRHGLRLLCRGFNPRPTNWPGDAMPRWRWCSGGSRRFNPRPTNWPGDARGLAANPVDGACFNPRPTNWPGDAEGVVRAGQVGVVSIRARPIGRAMPRRGRRPARRRHVSIRARPIGRAMRWPATRSSCPRTRFNPRPTNWPGDAGCRSHGDDGG